MNLKPKETGKFAAFSGRWVISNIMIEPCYEDVDLNLSDNCQNYLKLIS